MVDFTQIYDFQRLQLRLFSGIKNQRTDYCVPSENMQLYSFHQCFNFRILYIWSISQQVACMYLFYIVLYNVHATEYHCIFLSSITATIFISWIIWWNWILLDPVNILWVDTLQANKVLDWLYKAICYLKIFCHVRTIKHEVL